MSIENPVVKLSEDEKQNLLNSFQNVLKIELQAMQDRLKEEFQIQLQSELQPLKDQLAKLERELKKQKASSQREMLI